MSFKLGVLLLVAAANGYKLASTGRIVNGSTATLGQFPYQVSLRETPNSHFCGGSILNQNVVLTAAHCVYVGGAEGVFVVAGVIKIDDLSNVYEAEALISHENFDPENIWNDIGLVKLKTSIQYGENIKSIAMETNEISNGVFGVVSGWGVTSEEGQHATYLQYLNSEVLNYEECKEHIPAGLASFIKSFNICGGNEVGYGVCRHDSGGPFVADGKQIGVLSWGAGCALGNADVYSKVSYYTDWINSNQ